MNLNKALFYLAVICITTVLADYRHFPDRSTMFSEERHSNSMPFLRNLASTSHNSQIKSSSGNNTEPVTVRLQGSTDLGYYYVTLFFGSPVQKQTLIVDTGSVTTTIPCTECGDECGKHHFDRPFNHKNSKSFEEFKCEESFGDYSCYDCSNQCPFSVGYVEGSSYSGHFNKDFVVFGNEIEDNYSILKHKEKKHSNKSENTENTEANDTEKEIRESVEAVIEERKVFMPFGCTTRETKLFYEQEADGILGLGVNTNTHSSPPNLLDALHLQNSGFSKAFSLCLAQEGGYFTMGGYNGAYHVPEEKTHYTPYTDTYGQYKVFLHSIQIEGEDVGLKPAQLNSGEGAFFDSGTTLTHVPSATYNAIRGNMQTYCKADEQRCGSATEANSFCWKYNQEKYPTLASFYETFPTFTWFFGKDSHAEYEWKAEDYLYLKDAGENLYCLGLSHYERESILGGTFMKNHDILFDKENKRLGFVRSNCNGVQEVSKPTYMAKEVPPAEVTQPEETSFAVFVFNKVETTSTLGIAIITGISLLFVCIVLGVTAYLYRRYKRRTSYQSMRNSRIELSIDNLDTPQPSTSQPHQEDKVEANAEPAVVNDETSPEIEIDMDI